MSLGEKITQLRQGNGISQDKLAEMLNVSTQAIIMWEGNAVEPNLTSLKGLANAFNITLDNLLDNNSNTEKKENKNNTPKKQTVDNQKNIVIVNNANTKINQITCEKCGASQVEKISDDFVKCQNCGSVMQINRPAINKVITNNFFGKNDQSDNIFVIENKRAKEDFIREALITCASDVRSPVNLFEANFEEVKIENTQYIGVEADYFASFTATIGYDEKIRYGNNTETFTNWKPFAGQKNYHDTYYVNLLADDRFEDGNRFSNFLNSSSNLNIQPFQNTSLDMDYILPSQSKINSALAKGEWRLEYSCKYSLPGDRNKDFNITISHNVCNVKSYIVPQYFLPFTLNGKSYDIRSYMSSNESYLGNCPDATKNQNDNVDDKTKISGIWSIAISIFSMIASIISLFLIKNYTMYLVITVLFLISLIGFIIYKIDIKNTTKNIKGQYQECKKQDLIKYLKEHNLSPLTETEMMKFDEWRKKK